MHKTSLDCNVTDNIDAKLNKQIQSAHIEQSLGGSRLSYTWKWSVKAEPLNLVIATNDSIIRHPEAHCHKLGLSLAVKT